MLSVLAAPLHFCVVDVTGEIECISYFAIIEFIHKFHVQALKKIIRTEGGNIYELALVKDVRT